MRRGFTLIETSIYIALFGLLMTGAVVAAYNLLEGSSRAQTRTMLQEEGAFVHGKIEWALRGADTVSTPASNAVAASLTVSTYDGTTITIDRAGTDMRLDEGSAPQVLNTSAVGVTKLLFAHTLASGNGTHPETVQFSFEVQALTRNGMLLSERFPTTTIALRH